MVKGKDATKTKIGASSSELRNANSCTAMLQFSVVSTQLSVRTLWVVAMPVSVFRLTTDN